MTHTVEATADVTVITEEAAEVARKPTAPHPDLRYQNSSVYSCTSDPHLPRMSRYVFQTLICKHSSNQAR